MAKQYYCFLEKFNNYFNRKIIKYESLSDYVNNSKDSFIPTDSEGGMTPFDFNPNDNVTTEIIANDVPFDPDYFLLLDENQAIVQRWFVLEQKRNRQGQWLYQLKRDVVSDNLDNLLNAPIFVQKGMLKEDDPFIVNDEGMSLNQIKKNELLIADRSKTAWIVGYMAKNSGGADINIQVDNETINIDYVTLADIASAVGTTEGVLNSFLNFGDDTSNKAYFTTSVEMTMFTAYLGNYGESAMTPYNYKFDPSFTSGTGNRGTSGSYTSRPYMFISTLGNNQNNVTNPFRDAVIDKQALWRNQVGTMLSKSYYLTESQLNILRTFNGKYVKYNGQYYKFSVNDTGSHTTTVNRIKKDGTYSALDQTAVKTVELVGTSVTPFQTGTYNPIYPNAYLLDTLKSNEKEVVVSLKFLSPSDFIPQLNTVVSSGRKTTGDQEYDLFAIPLDIYVYNNGNDFETEENYARRIASAIAREENAKVYDLQLLPYCPVPELLGSSENSIDIDSLTEHTDFDFITKNIKEVYDTIQGSSMTFTPSGVGTWTGTATRTLSVPAGRTPTVTEVRVSPSVRGEVSDLSYSLVGNDITITFTYSGADPTDPSEYFWITAYIYFYYEETTNCGIMFYVPFSTFETNITKYELNPYWNDQFTKYSKKIVSNCSMVRLVSPNYQGAFEFNVAKNGGSVESFNVFCSYKPYTPVIKVAPNFEWLYGNEFKDNRGLICGGDFSLPRVTDEWRTYELNNKNYQNIFNRDIQHLDFTQNIEMRNQIVSGAVGIFSDSVKGGVAGGIATGSPYGAIAGAVIGGGASAVGYGIDVDTMARVHRENKQLAIDKFNYQLGNIKALPYTLTKVGSFDVISKIFPFIEVYWCSDEELEAFENKIRYESMTVMRIGTLQEFISQDSELHYFKGALIRNDEIADDTHILNAIYEELLKGVYI